MSDGSQIEWTDATWNPTTGCTKISPGCAHCYIDRTPAFRIAGRRFEKGHIPLELHENRLQTPLRWRRPRMVFVNSLSDLFHHDVPDKFIDTVFAVMALADWHTFQVLTKRPERMADYVTGHAYGRWSKIAQVLKCDRSQRDNGFPLRNVWLGTTTEDQKRADERIPHLLRCSAAVRFLSCEPLLGPVDVGLSSATCDCCDRWPSRWVELPEDVRGDWPIGHMAVAPAGVYRATSNQHGALSVQTERGLLGIKPHEFNCLGRVDWVIAGGESGPKARPAHPEWIRSLRDQCTAASVPFFFKQWGEWVPSDQYPPELYGVRLSRFPRRAMEPGHQLVFRVGKKRAGRLLDGEEWSEFHEAAELAASSR